MTNFGGVYKAKNINNNELYILKEFRYNNSKEIKHLNEKYFKENEIKFSNKSQKLLKLIIQNSLFTNL
ncbi:hypothetical protein [Mycoplasma crocodyli]|uniref:Uncharacterized protein n=1 Tax=Mycoplasma crocodyli (strain ATCC 51981 / MP145) TaxID=512564 RepID=D5E5T2_MYCCM|nr:hypothetical protein [Mycoplasma crocodyli]ADE20001.1 conserved hypothetical protein [Mycoplasma crocodyli MP145]